MFDWMFEGAVELPVRKWPEGLERSLGEIRDEIARAKAAAEDGRRILISFRIRKAAWRRKRSCALHAACKRGAELW